ncbi:MAG TPA: YfiR family protein [Burkholderiaceae bacterium]|nr:YfiR family protein [Burkholderiaceae bacterium]
MTPSLAWRVRTGLLALLLWHTPLLAQGLGEDDLKAQVVLRALLFFDWPTGVMEATQPMLLCLAAPGSFAAALERVRGAVINGHRLEVRRVAASELRTCHLAYVGPAEAEALQGRSGSTVLLGDAHGLLDRGVVLNLQTDQNRVVFDINLAAARRAGVQISARLLRLARYVRQD